MKKIQILGTGCPACNTLAERAGQAATALHLECEIEKVTEMDRILAFDIASTPALVVDGEVKVNGRVPTLDEIKEFIA